MRRYGFVYEASLVDPDLSNPGPVFFNPRFYEQKLSEKYVAGVFLLPFLCESCPVIVLPTIQNFISEVDPGHIPDRILF